MSEEKRSDTTLGRVQCLVAQCLAQCSNSEADRLKKEFAECLGAIVGMMDKGVHLLLRDDLISVYMILGELGLSNLKMNLRSLQRADGVKSVRRDVFSRGVPAESLRTSLEKLFDILQIDNSFMLIRSEQSLWLEARETFLRKFVNILELDEDNNVKGDHGSVFMHWLVCRNEQTILRLLLDRNVNMDECDPYGRTPFYLACHRRNEEIVAMFMYYNVSPNGSLVEIRGEIASRDDSTSPLGMIIEYVHDQWSEFDFNMLLELILNESRYFSSVVEIYHENLSPTSSIIYRNTNYLKFWGMMHKIPSSFLEKALVFFTRNKEAFDDLMECFSCDHWRTYWSHITLRRSGERKNFFQNLHALANTIYVGEDADEPKTTILQAMMDKIYHRLLPLVFIINNFKADIDQGFEVRLDEIEPIMLVLLSNGAPMDDLTMQLIMKEFGGSDFFKFCRLLPVESNPCYPYRFAADFYFNFSSSWKTMWQVVSDPANYPDIELNIDYYTSMSSHPNVKKIAYRQDSEALTAKVDAQPEFPTLLELARDGARTYVVEKYRVQKSWQFYEAVKALEISENLKKIIAYEIDSPLYR